MTSYEFEKAAKNAVIDVLSDDINFMNITMNTEKYLRLLNQIILIIVLYLR